MYMDKGVTRASTTIGPRQFRVVVQGSVPGTRLLYARDKSYLGALIQDVHRPF
jgi:hypothetical protein